jgi:hypothetical protein
MISCILPAAYCAMFDEHMHELLETVIKNGFAAYVAHFGRCVRYKDNLAFKPTEIWDLSWMVAT